jgi:hypothetical protein
MKNLKDIILEKLIINKNTKINKYHYHPKTRSELEKLISKLIDERGNDANLNDIDTSEITDMQYLFSSTEFNGDISQWDVSNVKDMYQMFYNSSFNGDISEWNTTNLYLNGMKQMFKHCPLEKHPPKWYKK